MPLFWSRTSTMDPIHPIKIPIKRNQEWQRCKQISIDFSSNRPQAHSLCLEETDKHQATEAALHFIRHWKIGCLFLHSFCIGNVLLNALGFKGKVVILKKQDPTWCQYQVMRGVENAYIGTWLGFSFVSTVSFEVPCSTFEQPFKGFLVCSRGGNFGPGCQIWRIN